MVEVCYFMFEIILMLFYSHIMYFFMTLKLSSLKIKVNTCKWFICWSYNPNRINFSTHLGKIRKVLDIYTKKYGNILLMGNYNVVKETNLEVFCNQHNLKPLNGEPTIFKKFNKASCIELFLTNTSKNLKKCFTLETTMSDFHKPIITILY